MEIIGFGNRPYLVYKTRDSLQIVEKTAEMHTKYETGRKDNQILLLKERGSEKSSIAARKKLKGRRFDIG